MLVFMQKLYKIQEEFLESVSNSNCIYLYFSFYKNVHWYPEQQQQKVWDFVAVKTKKPRLLLGRKHNYTSNYRNVKCKHSFINELQLLKGSSRRNDNHLSDVDGSVPNLRFKDICREI